MGVGFPKISEAEFTQQVLQLAKLRGYRTAHFRPAMLKDSPEGEARWVTAVQGDGKGFPDLVLVRENVMFVELKVGKNPLTPEQNEWIASLRLTGVAVYVWRPEDWTLIERTLE